MSERKKFPNRRANATSVLEYKGLRYLATAGYFDNGDLGEIFLEVPGRAGSSVEEAAKTASILVSLLLQHGVPASEIEHSITGPIQVALKMFSEGT